jgi:hypothetical protein
MKKRIYRYNLGGLRGEDEKLIQFFGRIGEDILARFENGELYYWKLISEEDKLEIEKMIGINCKENN